MKTTRIQKNSLATSGTGLMLILFLLLFCFESCKKDDDSQNNRSSTGTYYCNVQFDGTTYNLSQSSYAGSGGALLCQQTTDPISGDPAWGITGGQTIGLSGWTLSIVLINKTVGQYQASISNNQLNVVGFTPNNSNGLSYTTAQYPTMPEAIINITESNGTYIKGEFSGEVSPLINGNTDVYSISGNFKVPFVQ